MANLELLLKREEEAKNRVQNELKKRNKANRAIETRKKIIVGSMVFKLMERDEKLKNYIWMKLANMLNPRDKALFNIDSQTSKSPT